MKDISTEEQKEWRMFLLMPRDLQKFKRHFVKSGYVMDIDRQSIKTILTPGGDPMFSALKYPGSWQCTIDPEYLHEIDHMFNGR